MTDKEHAAAAARRTLSALEHLSACARDLGDGLLTERFWAMFGEATAAVRVAERAVMLEQEAARK